MTRRNFLQLGAAAGAVGVIGPVRGAAAGTKAKLPYYVFSRVFQFADCVCAASILKRLGYDGVEWTVRAKGHVEPSRAKTDLPKAVAAARDNGLLADMIVVDFLDPYEGANLDLLKVAADCGVKAFRPAYFRYDPAERIADSLARIRTGFAKLARAAAETGLRCQYQHHSTYNPKVPLFGSLCWDLWEVIRDYDPRHVGVQYDPMHAMAEQGPSWEHSLEVLAPWISTVCLKDFWFEPNEKNPKIWKRHLCPAGEGIVPFKRVRELLDKYDVRVPYSVHFDYKFPTEEAGAARCAGQDLAYYRAQLD